MNVLTAANCRHHSQAASWPRWLLTLSLVVLLTGCATRQPRQMENVCDVFDHQPSWYDDAVAAQESWGTPVGILMAFVYQESAFRRGARPPRPYMFGFIPLPRQSSAYGYAQIQDPAWQDYTRATGRRFASRSDMSDALDFIGWYNDISHRRLGLARNDARNLYLAYHEGHSGYQSGAWRNNRTLLQSADRVAARAQAYQSQYHSCAERFRCRRWYQFGPFCN